VVEEELFPWCNPCNLPHKQETCLVAQEAARLANEIYKHGSGNSKNYVGDVHDMINAISESSSEQVKGMKDLDQAIIYRALAPKPTQEEIKRRIQEKDWNTYQRRRKQVQPQHQEPPTQPSVPSPQP